jgi:hypothetical protein
VALKTKFAGAKEALDLATILSAAGCLQFLG